MLPWCCHNILETCLFRMQYSSTVNIDVIIQLNIEKYDSSAQAPKIPSIVFVRRFCCQELNHVAWFQETFVTLAVWHSPLPLFPTDNPANAQHMAPGLSFCLEWRSRLGRHHCHHCKMGGVSGRAETLQDELIPTTAHALSHQPTILCQTQASYIFLCRSLMMSFTNLCAELLKS